MSGDKTTHQSIATALSDSDLVKVVHDVYSAKAVAGASSYYSSQVASAFGYTAKDLQSIPDNAHMGLGCGNPVATATIKEGEVVLDLGSGGGIDVFLAASKVGPNGQAIGLDMSSDMVDLARRNAKNQGLYPPRVAFVKASLTDTLPIASSSVDCILSNCVINLLPLSGKEHVLKEAYRVLKPGGRIVLDDIIAKQALPADIQRDLASYVGCISGAIEVDQYRDFLAQAGFTDTLFVDTKGDINIYREAEGGCAAQLSCCSDQPNECSKTAKKLTYDPNDFVASYQIYAMKTGDATESASSAVLRKWWDAYPSPKSTAPGMSTEEVAALMRDSDKSGDFAVIDVRRNDHGGGHVRGSHQWPAQTFYDTLPDFYEQFGRTEKVIFYCVSSAGRGPRCAGWYQDYLNDIGATQSKSYVLTGGVNAWLRVFGNDEKFVDHD